MTSLKDKIEKLIIEGKQVLATKFEEDISPSPSSSKYGLIPFHNEPIIQYYVNDSIFNKWFKKVEITLKDTNYSNEIIKPMRFETNLGVTKRQLSNLEAIYELLSEGIYNINPCAWEYLTDKIISLYNDEHYPEAVFEAFKYIEDQVRKLSKLNNLYGTDLMRKAFALKDENRGKVAGALTNQSLPTSEQQSQADLYAGALGFIKNPKSHNILEVHKEKATELLYFANYLLRIIDGDYSPRL